MGFNEQDYTVIREEEFSEYKGKYRVICYSNGYYGLQKYLNERWFTLVIAPVSIGEEYSGEEILNEILYSIKEADDSYNGKYWNLSVYLADDSNFMEIITKEDGETLFEQLKDLEEYERKQMEEYYESFLLYHFLKILFLAIIIILCIFLIISKL